MSEIKWSTNLIPFGPCGDKFCSGYREAYTMEERIRAASKIKGLQGIELHYPDIVNEENLSIVKKSLSDTELVCSLVTPSLSGEAKWMRGALTNSNTQLRKEAIERVKKAMDVSVELRANKINLWPGQDGYDYPLQTDYLRSWNMIIEAVNECALYNPKVKICLEYKLKEPRTHIFMGTVGKILFLIDSVNLENVGGNLDVGHAFMAYENPTESALLLHQKGKLFHIHLNDNSADWDWDMIAGTIHIFEFLEFLFWLREIDYSGWYSFDQYPAREDPIKAIQLSINNLESLREVIGCVDASGLKEAFKNQDFVKSLELIRPVLYTKNKSEINRKA